MDTQNNGKGGYGYGGDKDNVADNLKYMVGSELTMEWTSQNSAVCVSRWIQAPAL